jgi:hypothetical protein
LRHPSCGVHKSGHAAMTVLVNHTTNQSRNIGWLLNGAGHIPAL